MMLGFAIILVVSIPLIAVILDSHLGRALARRLEREPLRGDGALGLRVTELEAEVERLTRELQRLEEQSDFLHRLLQERPSSGGLMPPGDAND